MNTILTVGADRVMFGTDSPFEKMGRAADWLDTLDAIGETDRVKIARTNAEKLFKLGALAKSDASA